MFVGQTKPFLLKEVRAMKLISGENIWAMKLISGENIWQFEKKIYCSPSFKGLKYWRSLTRKNKAAADQIFLQVLLENLIFISCYRIQFRNCPLSEKNDLFQFIVQSLP